MEVRARGRDGSKDGEGAVKFLAATRVFARRSLARARATLVS